MRERSVDIITVQEIQKVLINIPFSHENFNYIISVIPAYKTGRDYEVYPFINQMGDSLECSDLKVITTDLNTEHCFVWECEFIKKKNIKTKFKTLIENIDIFKKILVKDECGNFCNMFCASLTFDDSNIEDYHELKIIGKRNSIYLEIDLDGEFDLDSNEVKRYYNEVIYSIKLESNHKKIIDKLNSISK